MSCPSSFSGLFSEFNDECTHEFAHAAQDGRPYYGDVFSDALSESPHRYETPMSQQSISSSFADIELSPTYTSSNCIFTQTGERTNYIDQFPDTESDAGALEASQDSTCPFDYYTFEHADHLDHLSKFNHEIFSLVSNDESVEIVGTTYSASINSKVNLKNLSRIFQYLPPPETANKSKKCNNIPKKVTPVKKNKSGPSEMKHSVKFKIDLDIFEMVGFACGDIFSNGKILLSSIHTDDDELAKTILNHVAQSIQDAHFVSIANDPSASVIECNYYDPNFSIIPDSLSIMPQLQLSVPFRIKYSRLDQAYRDGLLESPQSELVAMESKKEKATGHGYGVKYDCFSVTVYHTGKIQARTFKPHLSRLQLKNALLRVRDTLLSIQHIIEVQGSDTFDGSKRRNYNTASGKQLRTSPSPFKSQYSL
jgi:hypothetical protein